MLALVDWFGIGWVYICEDDVGFLFCNVSVTGLVGK